MPAVAIGSEITTVRFQNTTAAIKAGDPVTFGQRFKLGDLPGASAAVELRSPTNVLVPCQMDVKSLHPDGSVKQTLLSAIIPLGASASDLYSIRRKAAPATGTAAVPADFPGLSASVLLTDTGIDVSGPIVGLSYTADAAAKLAAGQYETYLSGPIVSEWLIRVPLTTSGGSENLDLHGRFNIRAYAGQARARVDFIIENNWAKEKTVPSGLTPWESVSITDKVYRFSLKIGATTVHARAVAGKQTTKLTAPQGTYDGNATGLANNATTYTATITVDGVAKPISIIGSAAQNYGQLCSLLNTQMGGAAIAATDPQRSSIVFKSATTGAASSVVIAYGTLFPGLGHIEPYRPIYGDEKIHRAGARHKYTYWYGAAPTVHIAQERVYLVGTKASPNFAPGLTGDAATIANTLAALLANEDMGENGITKAYFADVGYAPGIGIWPEWGAMYMVNQSIDAKYILLKMADLAGGWPVHERDYYTDLPVSFTKWPYATTSPNGPDSTNPATGLQEKFPVRVPASTLPPNLNIPDGAHCPDFYSLPYLITGDHYYLEGLLFYQRYINFGNAADTYRDAAKGLWWRDQVRSQAWALRTTVHALDVIPDAHPLRTEIQYNLEQNRLWYSERYLNAGIYSNQLGVIIHDGAVVYFNGIGIGGFQDDFFTAAVGRAVELGHAAWLPLLQFKAKFPVGRLTSGPSYCWQGAASIFFNVRATSASSIYATFGEVFSATFPAAMVAAQCGTQAMTTAMTPLEGSRQTIGSMAGYPDIIHGYPSNLQPAVAYAASYVATGADAWTVFDGRSVKPNYNVGPQFAIVPREGEGMSGADTPPDSQYLGVNMKFANRVKTTTATTGTGNITVAGAAATRFRPLSDIAVGTSKVVLTIEDEAGSDWEESECTILSGTTFSRDTVLGGSNYPSKTNFAAGSKAVFATSSAQQMAGFDLNSSTRVFYLSKCGAFPDADVTQTSTSFGTDSTAAIQAVLDLASTSNPIKVIVDGGYSVTGLRIKGNTHLDIMPGCGLVLRTGSNKTLIENYNLSWDPLVRTDKNIKITGGTLNGNRGSGGANNIKGNGTVGLVCCARFYGVENLEVSDVLFVNFPGYSLHRQNCKHSIESNTKHDVGAGSVINNDGTNTGGNCEDVVLRDLVMNCADDPISVSPDDVWRAPGGFTYPFYPATANAPLKNVLVDNVLLSSQVYGVRLMSGANLLDDVVIRNLRGTTTLWALLLDNRQVEGDLVGATGAGNIGTVIIDGMDVSVTSGVAVIRIRSSVRRLIIKNLRRGNFGAAIPTILIDGTGVTIDHLEIDGYDCIDLASSQVLQHISIVGATVNHLKISNVNVRRGAANGSNLVTLTSSSTVQTVQLDGIKIDGIDSLLLNTSGTITRILATNIIHLNPASGKATFDTASTIARIGMSAYIGTTATNGTFTVKSGDALPATVDSTPPTITSVTVADATPTQVDIVFSETMTISDVPANTAVTFSGGTARTTSALAWLNSTTLRATVSAAVASGETFTLNITQPGTNNIRDAATTPNALANVTARAITNNVGLTTPVAVTFAGDANLVQSGNTKALTGAAASAYAYYAYIGSTPTQKLALGTNGYVGLTYVDSGATNVELGFVVGAAAMPSAGFAIVGGTLVPLQSGTYLQTPRPALVAGTKYIVRVVGTVITLESSPDGTTWTVIYTYVPTRTADLNVTMRLYNTSVASFVQGVNLS